MLPTEIENNEPEADETLAMDIRQLLPLAGTLLQDSQSERLETIRALRKVEVGRTPVQLSQSEKDLVPGVVLGLLAFATHNPNPPRNRRQALEALKRVFVVLPIRRSAYVVRLCVLSLKQVISGPRDDRGVVNAANSLLVLLDPDSESGVQPPKRVKDQSDRSSLAEFAKVVESQELRVRTFHASERAETEKLLHWLYRKSFSEDELREVLARLQRLVRDCGLELLYNGAPATLYPRPEARKTGKFAIIQGKKRKSTTYFPELTCRPLASADSKQKSDGETPGI